MNILGIDPGLRLTGFACLRCPIAGPGMLAARPDLVDAGVLRLDAKRSVADRLVELEADLLAIFEEHQPALVAVEKVYAHGKHPLTAAIMAHARGVVLLVARRRGCTLLELAPNEVKRSLTGHGLAKKTQMQHAVAAIFNLPGPPDPPDIADAIAMALCAAHRLPLATPTLAPSRPRRRVAALTKPEPLPVVHPTTFH